MTKVLVTEGYLRNIAEAIRSKNGASTAYRPGDMAAAIQAIPTGGITPTGTVNITQNGNHDVTQYASANVNVQPNLQTKTATQNGEVTPDSGYDGLSSVVVNVSGGGGGGGYPDAVAVMDFTKYSGVFRGVTYSAAGAVFPASGAASIIIPYFAGGMTLYLDVASMQLTSGEHRRFIMANSTNGLIYRSTGKWAFYNGSWEDSAITDGDFFDGAKVKVYVDANNKWHIYKDNILAFEPTGAQEIVVPAGNNSNYTGPFIGSSNGQIVINAVFTGLRVYQGDYTE